MGRPSKDPKVNLYKLMKKAFETALEKGKIPADPKWIVYQEIEKAQKDGILSPAQALKLKAQLAPKLETHHHEVLYSVTKYVELLRKVGFLDFYSKLPEEPAWDRKGE